MGIDHTQLATFDTALWQAMQGESKRQEAHIELIASENYVSPRVMVAQGSLLTNKYAEGYPHRRYYGGCHWVDQVEELAIDRAKKLFGADYVNVQPHSGSQANAAVYLALLEPGDLILGMGLNEGGHLTHGSSVSFSGQLYHAMHYGLDAKTGEIDYDAVEKLALKHRPKLIIAGFSAYSRVVDWQRFRAIADGVDAYLMADMAHVAGLIIAGCYPSPLGIADVVTTTTHKTLRGPRGGMILTKDRPEWDKKLNAGIFPGFQGGPLMHVIAAKAVAFLEAMQPSFTAYQKQVVANARMMANTMIDRGYNVLTGGTDNHLFLVNLIGHALNGKQIEQRLEKAHMTLNKNAVPGDPLSPFKTSGIRIGSPAITTRGFKEEEAAQVATWICDILDHPQDDALLEAIRQDVQALCVHFPVYRVDTT